MLLTLLRLGHIFEKVNFVLSVVCNNEKKLKVTLAKVNFKAHDELLF